MSHIQMKINQEMNFKERHGIVGATSVAVTANAVTALQLTPLQQVQSLLLALENKLTNGASAALDTFGELETALNNLSAIANQNGLDLDAIIASMGDKLNVTAFEDYQVQVTNALALKADQSSLEVVSTIANDANAVALATVTRVDNMVSVISIPPSAWTIVDGLAVASVETGLPSDKIDGKLFKTIDGTRISDIHVTHFQMLNGTLTLNIEESFATHTLEMRVTRYDI